MQEIRYTIKIADAQGIKTIQKHQLTGKPFSKWSSFQWETVKLT